MTDISIWKSTAIHGLCDSFVRLWYSSTEYMECVFKYIFNATMAFIFALINDHETL